MLSSHANDAKTMRAIVLVILTGIRAWTPSPRPRRCTALRAHPAFKQKKDPKYSLEAAVEAGEAAQRASVPQSFDDVLDEMGASVAAALDAGGARFLVECLPPGLNPELEMTCPYDPSRELAVVQALLNAIPFGGFIVFIGLSTGSRNPQFPRFVRFSMQQAVLLDIALIFPQLFQSIFGATNIKVPEALVEPASSFVFFFIFLASVYSCGSNILGKQPNQIPIISSAAEQSIGPF